MSGKMCDIWWNACKGKVSNVWASDFDVKIESQMSDCEVKRHFVGPILSFKYPDFLPQCKKSGAVEQLYYTDENLGDACDQAFWKLLQLSPITQSLKHKSQLGEGAKKT